MALQKQAREIQYFFYSQAFADGVRITAAILLPALISYHFFNDLQFGMAISLGALCVSLTDAPGPIIHKKNGMIFCAVFIFLTTLLTYFTRENIYIMGFEIMLVSFFFSMFGVYGNRAISVGNAALLAMILTMDRPVPPGDEFLQGFLVFSGGIWYLLISLLFYNLQPYRLAQRSLGECIRELANYLSYRADFYDTSTELDRDYRNMVSQQILVSEKQDAVREILFKTRQIVDESTTEGRKLVWAFVETVDLFEEMTATYYDYTLLRKRFASTSILEKISVFIKKLSHELDQLGIEVQKNGHYRIKLDTETELKFIKEKIDLLEIPETESKLVLKKILVNLRRVVQHIHELSNYFEKKEIKRKKRVALDHSHFVTHQPLDPRILLNNLTIHSSVFKHAIRVSIACIAGFMVSKIISYGHHTYWILLTIAFILKPAFSLTKERNIQRIIGTIAGGVIGVLILAFIPNKDVQFTLMVLFMIASYSFMRIHYLAMVIFITPYVMILLNIMGVGFVDVAKERVLDTVIGCAIAFSASYFLFPTWESGQLKQYIKSVIDANAAYLEKILEGLQEKQISPLEFKLVRKEVYVSSANLSSAFQRMLSEPRSKQTDNKLVHQFVVLSHLLFSNIATVVTSMLRKDPRPYPKELLQSAKRSLTLLKEVSKKIDGEEKSKESVRIAVEAAAQTETISSDDVFLKDQLDFIYKLVTDIDKTAVAILKK